MNRVVIASVAVAALAGASVLGWFEVRQARDFRRLIAVGDAALAREQTYAAIEAYSGAIALRRGSMLGWLKRGDTYRHRGELNRALRDLEQAAALDPTAPRPMELLGDVNAALGRQARAADYYNRYTALDDRAPRVLYKLALADYRLGQSLAAIDPLRKAIAIDRQLGEAHYLLGLCFRDAKRMDDAVAALTRAVAVNPALDAAREELAALQITLGRRRDAIEQLEALAALEPRRPERQLEVGLTYARLGRPDAAILTLGRAAERDPQAADIYLALARVWLDIAEDREDPVAVSKAMQALQTAAGTAGDSRELLALRGRAQYLAGDAAGAERTLDQATAVLPVDPSALRYLALAAADAGHASAARVARARYEALKP